MKPYLKSFRLFILVYFNVLKGRIYHSRNNSTMVNRLKKLDLGVIHEKKKKTF
nr:MAG TPA: hypothetical protein [Caudoviricetes sp.]